jgi:hypothetical protein
MLAGDPFGLDAHGVERADDLLRLRRDGVFRRVGDARKREGGEQNAVCCNRAGQGFHCRSFGKHQTGPVNIAA